MKNINLYKQCTLRHKSGIIVAWIPASFAKQHKFLRLKEQGKWQDGWEILEVHNTLLPKNVVTAHKDAYKEAREVTDI